MTDPRSARQSQTFQTMLGTVGQWLDDQAVARAQTQQRLDHDIVQLTEQVAGLRAQVSQLEQRFTQLLAAEHERRRPETPRSEDLGYYDLAEDLDAFYETLGRVARETLGTRSPRPERARLVARLMEALRLGHHPEDLAVILSAGQQSTRSAKSTAKQLQSEFGDIMDRAAKLGRECRWLRPTASDGPHIEPARQRPWPGCSPDEPILFQVIPAFVVEGTIRARAVVYTGTDQPADGTLPS